MSVNPSSSSAAATDSAAVASSSTTIEPKSPLSNDEVEEEEEDDDLRSDDISEHEHTQENEVGLAVAFCVTCVACVTPCASVSLYTPVSTDLVVIVVSLSSVAMLTMACGCIAHVVFCTHGVVFARA